MYSFSFVVASIYALPMSAHQTFMLWIEILLALVTLLKLLQSICCLLDQELDDHQLLVLLYGVHHLSIQKPGAH